MSASSRSSRCRIGFVLVPHGNGSYVVSDQTDLKRCEKCGQLLDRNCSTENFKLKKKRDLSCSEDKRVFGSERFRETWTREGGEGLIFKPLRANPGYYHLDCKDVLEFDTTRAMFHTEDYCRVCKQHAAFVGANPTHLKRPELLKPNGAYHTDLIFGTGDAMTPLLMVGLEIGFKLKAAKFSGWCAADVLL